MKAVKEQPQFRLTSNFTFRTMQKVEEAILLREKKQERKMLLATIAASLFLIISSSIGLYIYFGKHLKATMYHAFSHVLKIQIPLIYLLFSKNYHQNVSFVFLIGIAYSLFSLTPMNKRLSIVHPCCLISPISSLYPTIPWPVLHYPLFHNIVQY